MKIFFLTLFIVFFVSGCDGFVHPKDRYDISNDEPFRRIIGKTFETTKTVQLVEHNDDPNRDIIRFYGIHIGDSMYKSRFINNQYRLPVGQKFLIVKVTKYSKWFDFLGGTDAIAILQGGQFSGLLVVIDLSPGNQGKNKEVLNPNYFRRIE